MCVYWPGMEADVMDYIKQCVTCIDNAKMPVETLHPHEVPAGPWIKIGMDFFQDDSGQKFLIVADYFSKFPFIFPVTSTHHQKTLRYLRDLFSTKGVPSVVMTNNGPPFNGEEFKCFTREFDFKHQTSSPHFHQSNGFIEAMVKKVKAAYKKTDGSPNAQARALLQLYAIHQSQKTCHHQQRFYMDSPHKELSCPDVTDPSTSQESADIY